MTGAPSGAEGGQGGAGTISDPDSEVQVIMTAIGNQEKWILSQGRLEQQGCRFRYSFGLEGPWLITRGGLNVRLGPGPHGMPHLHGTFVHPGKVVACQPEEPSSVPLLLDTSATLHVAGNLWRPRLKVFPESGSPPAPSAAGCPPAPAKAHCSFHSRTP